MLHDKRQLGVVTGGKELFAQANVDTFELLLLAIELVCPVESGRALQVPPQVLNDRQAADMRSRVSLSSLRIPVYQVSWSR